MLMASSDSRAIIIRTVPPTSHTQQHHPHFLPPPHPRKKKREKKKKKREKKEKEINFGSVRRTLGDGWEQPSSYRAAKRSSKPMPYRRQPINKFDTFPGSDQPKHSHRGPSRKQHCRFGVCGVCVCVCGGGGGGAMEKSGRQSCNCLRHYQPNQRTGSFSPATHPSAPPQKKRRKKKKRKKTPKLH